MASTARAIARGLTWPLAPGLLVAAAAVTSPSDTDPLVSAGDVPYLVALVACWLVGVVLTGRAFDQLAGWSFLGLGTALAWSAATDVYTEHALRTHATGGPLAATWSDTSFVWWFVFLALVLQLTPPARDATPMRRLLPLVTLGAGVLFQAAALLRGTHLDPPHAELVSPWALDRGAGAAAVVAAVAVFTLGGCLLASVAVLVRVWRRAQGVPRQQLMWLTAGALPLPACVVGAFALSFAGRSDLAGYPLVLAMVTLAAGAMLSVLRYRLYDVERVLSESAGYAIASAAVVVTFVVVVVAVSRTTPVAPTSQLPTVLGTLAAVGAARASYVWGRRAVDRRVNRERFDALTTVRSGLAATAPDLDALLRTALRDPRARVLYPADGGAWVTTDGHEVPPDPTAVDVRRGDTVTARIEFDPKRSDRAVVEALAAEAAAEIDNVSLRAELARQLELIRESRSRLATAQLEERRRIERDLHDGAQQRLLAIALQLRSAQVNGRPEVLHDEVGHAVAELGATVQELRDLAAGLQPAALAGRGLLGAVADLAVRAPLAITYDVVDQRFPASIEGAAWFVIAEATTNAVKHARVDDVRITVQADEAALRVVVEDRGIGRACPDGRGLQGLSDRVAALRGQLRVTENTPHGTVVEAELPCVS